MAAAAATSRQDNAKDNARDGAVHQDDESTQQQQEENMTFSEPRENQQSKATAREGMATQIHQPTRSVPPVRVSPPSSPAKQGFAGLTQGVTNMLGAAAASLSFSTPSSGRVPSGATSLNNSFTLGTQDVNDSQLLGAVGGEPELLFAPNSPTYAADSPDPEASRQGSPKAHRNNRKTRSNNLTDIAEKSLDEIIAEHEHPKTNSRGRGRRR